MDSILEDLNHIGRAHMTMVLSLLEVVIYGVVGYGTLMMIVSLIITNKFPETPVQAGIRGAFCIPGFVCLAYLAFTVVGETDTPLDTSALGEIVIDIDGGAYDILYDTAHIPVMRENRISQESILVDDIWVPGGSNGTYSRYVTYQDIEIGEPRMWLLVHMLFIGAVLLWVVYQFAVMLQLAFKRPTV